MAKPKNKAIQGSMKRLSKHPPQGLSSGTLRSLFEKGQYRSFTWSNSTISWPDD